jgi:hypothetical protein
MKPLPRWDNGRDVVLAGDAAGVVAPASGEGIYYAMAGGRLAGEAAHLYLRTGEASALKLARKRFMKAHGTVFWVLGGPVRGGRIVGEQVKVDRAALHQDRDFQVVNEYRAVLGGMFATLYGLDAARLATVFPGATPKDLGLV